MNNCSTNDIPLRIIKCVCHKNAKERNRQNEMETNATAPAAASSACTATVSPGRRRQRRAKAGKRCKTHKIDTLGWTEHNNDVPVITDIKYSRMNSMIRNSNYIDYTRTTRAAKLDVERLRCKMRSYHMPAITGTRSPRNIGLR